MAFDAFLKLDGVVGSSMQKGHVGSIEISSFAWDVRAGTAGTPRLSEIVVTKPLDRASATLFQKLCAGQAIGGGVLTVMRAGAEPVNFLKMTFTNVSVSRLAPAGDGSSPAPVEQLGLKCTDVKIEVTQIDPFSGKPMGTVTTTC
jgi:type VI secretion system secreted protein Hcp